MIKGQIAVTWTEADYKNLQWVTNEVHEEKFNATVDTNNYNVGVYMCFENLPTVFQDAVKEFREHLAGLQNMKGLTSEEKGKEIVYTKL